MRVQGNLIVRALRYVRRATTKRAGIVRAWSQGLRYEPPNFVFVPNLTRDSVVIDAGCSYEADFSMYMIRHFGAKAYGVDPTMKHAPALRRISQAHPDHFVHLPLAVGRDDGQVLFYESQSNESGSMMDDHINVRRDETTRYEVRVVSLRTLAEKVGAAAIDVLKLDLEGAEYPLLEGVTAEDLSPFRQIFVEFHHHALTQFSDVDTSRIVNRIRGLGYKAFTLDEHNYLFYRLNE